MAVLYDVVRRATSRHANCSQAQLHLSGASSQAATDSGDGGAEQLEPTIRQHRAELEALAQRDPEFYAYLKETDEDLLAFGVGEAESSDNDEGLAQELEVGGISTACVFCSNTCNACGPRCQLRLPIVHLTMSDRMKTGKMAQRRLLLGCRQHLPHQVGVSAAPYQ